MEAEQYTLDAGLWSDIDYFVNAQANPPGTPANAIVGVMYESSDRQTLNSYARLIWVRHLHPIPGNCQSLERRGKTRLSSHFRNFNHSLTPRQYSNIHEINNRKVMGKNCTEPDMPLGWQQP
ncbi:hypothetical protein [Pseudomonas sp. PWP3-1b2]|uniref:hypothetical protein n=1 Tax=Pseudomonas sp. PWP3-1b2 TaxID=2804656 RepID=UPI003CE9CC75